MIPSPLTNEPVTCVNFMVVLPPPAAIAYPVAPLLNPLTYDVSGSCALLTAELMIIFYMMHLLH